MKTLRPYIRQNVFDKISSAEFIFINSIFIGILSGVYAYIINGENPAKLWSLSYTQYSMGLFLGALTVISSIMIFNLQKDGIITTTFLIKSISSIVMLMVGVLFFNETINEKQMVGIVLGILAVFLIKG
jgi:drug/metabolite transporter (DMT)-like permease